MLELLLKVRIRYLKKVHVVQNILVDLGFKPLANPIMRNTVGRKTSLRMGSKLAGIKLETIIATLEANGYEVVGLD